MTSRKTSPATPPNGPITPLEPPPRRPTPLPAPGGRTARSPPAGHPFEPFAPPLLTWLFSPNTPTIEQS
ncbi:hypothetical protein CFP65_6064 [Kitasatospora sp. MMS16-BH015]|uniref:hypothetical protein n=1 Tax=Kitasatospora sp. MMS16-BH015 TaxID=2018025 RepID=UPI000CA2303B|nr:hypothetical protein [Kitasatospora sp. MMS16-BH015]AUG80734.1 hypothetical protein CFP65_6064 [Kitasatospora sp. MMS16-BH015]